MMSRSPITWTIAALVLGSACSSTPPLAHTASSPQTLGAAVLEALQRRDRTTLDALALSETEFRDHVWPQLPASRPERNLPFSYVWGDLHQKSDVGLARTLEQHGGKRYELVSVEFAGETDYVTYRVHRDARFRVRAESGAVEPLRVCGSMLEKDGTWKIFSYVVDE